MPGTLTRWWLSVSWVFILFAPFWRTFTHEMNRVEYGWSRVDSAALLLSLLVTGTAGFAAHEAMRRFVSQAGRLVLALALAAAFFPSIYYFSLVRSIALHPWLRQATWSLLSPVSLAWIISIEKWLAVGILLALIQRHPERIYKAARTALLVFSPTVLVFAASLVSYAPVVTRHVGHPQAARNASGPPVVILLFDEWSYPRTFDSFQPLADLPGVREMASSSLVFHRASSPAALTGESVPLLLGGALTKGATAWSFPDDSLLLQARFLGFSRHVLGWLLPYPRWFPDLDEAWVFAEHRTMDASLIDRIVESTLDAALFPSRDWLRRLQLNATYRARRHWSNTQAIQRRVLECVERLHGSFILFAHYPIPHAPFIHPAHSQQRALKHPAPVATYMGNLYTADDLLREAIGTMKKGELWDEALVVLTSDHSWRSDPKYSDHMHVPLLVKMPRQRSRVDINERFETRRLSRLLAAAMRRQIVTHEQLVAWLRRPEGV